MTASTSQGGMGEAMGDEASPFEPEYDTELTKTYTAGASLEELLSIDSPTLHLGSFDWAKIPFELRMEKLADVTDDKHKDLILHVDVHRDQPTRLGGPDPHWRCTFVITVRTKTQEETEWEESTTMSCRADKQLKSFIVPLRRLGEGAERQNFMTVEVNMKILSWAGVFPTPIAHSFSRKTDTTDATLKVDGRAIYVTRAFLAMRSKYFHGLFFNKSFKDHSNEEFELKDVAFDDMCTFLRLIYPPDSPEKPIRIANMASLEAMLELADRWDCPYVSKEMERYLLDEIKPIDTKGFTPSRCLYLADRYRLSTACNFNMTRLANARSLKGFVKTPEFKEISDGLCRTLLEMLAATEEDEAPASSRWDGDEGFSIKRARLSGGSRVHHSRAIVSASSAQVGRRSLHQAPVDAPSSSSSSRASFPAIPTQTAFNAMVGNVLQSAPGFALPSKQSAELLAGLRFLRDLSAAAYDNLTGVCHQRLLYEVLARVLSTVDRVSLHANVDELLVRVRIIPGGEAAIRQ